MDFIDEIIYEMFRRTDENGVLIMPAWRTPGEDKHRPRFFKCRMDPELEESTENSASLYVQTFAAIESCVTGICSTAFR